VEQETFFTIFNNN